MTNRSRALLAVSDSALTPGDYKPLMDMASMELYRRNLFRVLGFSVDANTAEVRQRQKRIEMRKKLNLPPEEAVPGPLALRPPPDAEQVNAALDRLNDPESRFLDEIFWFWPMQSGGGADDALAALVNGNIEAARHIWQEAAKSSNHDGIPAHNLAVLFHLQAMGLERRAQQTKEACKSDSFWKWGMHLWKQTTECDAFWSRMCERAREINDLKVTDALVQRVRDSLPRMLLTINVRATLGAAEKGDLTTARRNLDIVNKSGFEPSLIVDVLHESLGAIRHRIKATCETAVSKAAADEPHADAVMLDLHKEMTPLLAVVDLLLPADDNVRQALHDQVVEALLVCQVTYGNKTENWGRSLDLLNMILPLCGTDALRQRIDDNIKIVTKNKEVDCCYFCGQGKPEPTASIEVKMFGNVQKQYTGYNTIRTTWTTLTIKVPRCTCCRDGHKKVQEAANRSFGIGCLLSAIPLFLIVGFLVWVNDRKGEAAAFFVPGGLAGFFGGLIIGGICSAIGSGKALKQIMGNALPESKKLEFPLIKQRLKDGFQFGEKPAA